MFGPINGRDHGDFVGIPSTHGFYKPTAACSSGHSWQPHGFVDPDCLQNEKAQASAETLNETFDSARGDIAQVVSGMVTDVRRV